MTLTLFVNWPVAEEQDCYHNYGYNSSTEYRSHRYTSCFSCQSMIVHNFINSVSYRVALPPVSWASSPPCILPNPKFLVSHFVPTCVGGHLRKLFSIKWTVNINWSRDLNVIWLEFYINTYEQVAPVKLGLQVPPLAQKFSGQTATP